VRDSARDFLGTFLEREREGYCTIGGDVTVTVTVVEGKGAEEGEGEIICVVDAGTEGAVVSE
jgi:hypothetical protein